MRQPDRCDETVNVTVTVAAVLTAGLLRVKVIVLAVLLGLNGTAVTKLGQNRM